LSTEFQVLKIKYRISSMEYQVWDIKIGVQKYRISSTECRKYGMSSMDDEVLFLRPNHETIYQ